MKSCSSACFAGFQSHQPSLLARVSSKSPGEQRPLLADAVLHPGHQLPVGVAEPLQPAAGDVAHHGQREAVVLQRHVGGGMAPVFEGAAFADEPVEHVLPVAGDAREQHVVMGPGHHGDGVDLHVADPLQGLPGAGETGAELAGAAEALGTQGQPAQADGARGAGHRSCRGAPARPLSALAGFPVRAGLPGSSCGGRVIASGTGAGTAPFGACRTSGICLPDLAGLPEPGCSRRFPGVRCVIVMGITEL